MIKSIYAIGASCTMIYLTVVDFLQSLRDANGIFDWWLGEIFGFGIDTAINTFQAGVWPIYWLIQTGVI